MDTGPSSDEALPDLDFAACHPADSLADATSFLATQHCDFHAYTTPRAVVQHHLHPSTHTPLITALLAIHTALSLPPNLPSFTIDSAVSYTHLTLPTSNSV